MVQQDILLLDDDASFRASTSEFLADEGFLLRAAASGDKGIALVRQKVNPVSLTLVDFHMPDVYGPETIRQL